ncbi:hypothetical protein ACFPOB_06910 [Bosea eneae]|jgi:hypothetical protein|uniref:Peptidase C51 domain-containing protein n=2 Tax=Bosea eneae TaxID=151454 RepID=A0ABW0IMN2_9HYPH
MTVPDINNASDIGNYHFQPGDMVEAYWNIQVDDDYISINKYMIGIHNSDAGAQKRKAVQQAAAKLNHRIDQKAFTRASMGKVTPGDCQHILTMAVRSGLVRPGDLQAWADQCLGVDCTGFVVAYYNEIGRINVDKYSGGASCPFLVGRAVKNKAPGLESALIWEQDQVRVGDMMVWMNSRMVETRAPGHIALISYVDVAPDTLFIAESSGASDGSGHYGPKHNRKSWEGVKSSGGAKYIQIDKTGKVLIVRPPAWFG